MKNLIILGSTGSIGMQTLDIVRHNRNDFAVSGLACHSNIELLERQAREFGVKTAAVFDAGKARELSRKTGIDVLPGLAGIAELARLDPADLVVNALVGSIGIRPTVAAITAGRTVALANKETLVSAGDPVMALAERHGVRILPLDSEHSAIFQCLQGESGKSVKRLIITCSGGAFRDRTPEELRYVTAAHALKHPNWNMGAKITIDSATLMNKGFEVIEARVLFGTGYDCIDVLIHPQSIVHSLVEFIDTSVLAQLGQPDMRVPIQYALTYPDRIGNGLKPLDLARIGELSFSEPDTARFPCLRYAVEAGREGGTMPCVLNAANEVAVRAFLAGAIGFNDIAGLVRRKLDEHDSRQHPDLDEIIELDRAVKHEVLGELRMEEALHV